MGFFCDAVDAGPLRLELRSVNGRDFQVLRQIAYRADDGKEWRVPADLEHFRTDLASVPGVFTWLVPVSGVFLPAAVLHDGLVRPGAYTGPEVDRFEADRIFRVAMTEVGTGRVRAWLMWSAVTMATMWATRRLRLRAVLVGLVGLIALVGAAATLDLLDVWDGVPWMGARPWWQEVLYGAVAAALAPALLALTWGRRYVAGLIVGTALAFLLHVTVVVSLLYGGYLVLERLVSGPTDERGVHLDQRRPT